MDKGNWVHAWSMPTQRGQRMVGDATGMYIKLPYCIRSSFIVFFLELFIPSSMS